MTITPVTHTGRLRMQVAVATLARLVINSGYRMVYPFLPEISRGLNISQRTAGQLMTVRAAVGVTSPLFGLYSDRHGRRPMMAGGVLVLVAGAAIIALGPCYPAVILGFALLGMTKALFGPSLLAFLSERVPYERRGRAVAVVELAWGGSILAGIPLLGWVIEMWGWQAAFVVLAAAGCAALVALWRALPNDGPAVALPAGRTGLTQVTRLVFRNPAARAMMAVTGLMIAANEIVFIVYGGWMETEFGLSVGRVGLATAVIGAAELLGETGVGGIVDRLGKRRSLAVGLLLTAAGYLCLPRIAISLPWALMGLFFAFLFFEFTIVSTIPLSTEVVPAARATMMALTGTAGSLGRAAGAWVGTTLWELGGMAVNGAAAGLVTLLALCLVLAFAPRD